jgi:hypothetical protein
LTGSEVASSQQSIAPVNNPSTSAGQAVALSAGIVSRAGGGDVTVHIDGKEIAPLAGNLAPGRVLGGQQIATAIQTVPPSRTVPLTGQGITSSITSVVPGQEAAEDAHIESALGTPAWGISVALLGEGATAEQGDFVITGDDQVALVGEESATGHGTLPPVITRALTGQSITSAQRSMGAPGKAALTGASFTATAGNVFTVNDREYALVGQVVTSGRGSLFASPLAFVLGSEIAVGQQDIGPRVVTLTGESISVEQGDLGPTDGRMPEAGGSKKGRKPPRRPMTMEIDGEVFAVNSREEALALLEQAKKAAEENAAQAVERAAKAEKRPTRKVLKDAREALQEPEILASEDLAAEAEAVKAEIDAMYKDAMVKVEIAARLRREEDDDEAALLLLIQ